MPTKIAATRSMPSMKRSMALREGGAGAASGGSITGPASELAMAYCGYLRARRRRIAAVRLRPTVDGGDAQYDALYCVSDACNAFRIASGSPPAFLTLSAQFFVSGSAAFRHSASCSGEIE